MLYDDSTGFASDHSDDTDADPKQLLADLAALVDAGLVVPVRDRDGAVRLTPSGPLPVAAETWDEPAGWPE